MFRVTEVSWHCSDANTERDPANMRVVEALTSTAPQGDTSHPICRWWVQGGQTYRTPFMTGSVVDAR